MRCNLNIKCNFLGSLNRGFLMVLAVAFVVSFTSCGSDDDRLESLPWSNKAMFESTYSVDDNGYCLSNGLKPLSRQELESMIVGHEGWQPVAVYQVLSNGKLSTSDYREAVGDYSPRVYQFLSDSEMKTCYQDAETDEKCFRRHDWSYDSEQGIIFKDEKSKQDKSWLYMQILGVKSSGGNDLGAESSESDTYLYSLEKIAEQDTRNEHSQSIYALVVYKRLTSSETDGIVNTYRQDKSDKEEDESKIPEDCRFLIRFSYVNADDGYDYYHSKFQSFRMVKMELTDENGNNSSSNPYYQYFDSIVWNCIGMPDRVVSLRNIQGRHEVAYQLSTYFFHVNTDNKLTVFNVSGYKGGRPVYVVGTGITIWNQSGFLGYSFSSSELQKPSKADEDLSCIFDQGKRFRLLSPRVSPEYPDSPYAELRYMATMVPNEDGEYDEASVDKALEKEKKELADLMDSYYGTYNSYEGSKHVVVDESNIEKYRSRFKALPKDADIKMYWSGVIYASEDYSGLRIALVLHQDKENPQKSCYYIHAEPKK